MKITSVELHPEGSSDICVLSFRDPRRLNPYNVKAILGLDADDITPRYYGGPGTAKYHNLTLQKRDLVVRVELNPNFKTQTYSSLRDTIYKMIASSRTGIVQIQLKDGVTVVAAISGFVSKVEAPHFNKNPELQINIECTDPMLRALDPVLVGVTGLDPLNTVVDDTLSTAPHGLKFAIKVLANRASFEIQDVNNATNYAWKFKVTPSGGFLTNDVIHLSSEHDDKYVYLDRAGVITHLADVIEPGSIWPILFPGANPFVVIGGTTGYSWNSISYRPAYWGV